jgi:hypothetical protein
VITQAKAKKIIDIMKGRIGEHKCYGVTQINAMMAIQKNGLRCLSAVMDEML